MLARSPRAGSPPSKAKLPERTVQELLQGCVIVIDKPSGPTSHQVTSWVAQMFGGVKAAHGGTLDPRVTGVLPVGIGTAVRAMDALHYGTKAYVGVMRMHGSVDRQKLDNAFKEFEDEILQTPPLRSAVRREMRSRRIHSLVLKEISGRDVLFIVDCDAGTYIRSLCVDLGDAVAVGAHLQDLRRTRAGGLTEDMAVPLHEVRDAVEELKAGSDEHIKKMLRPKEVLFEQMPKVQVKDSAVDAICHGADLAMPGVVALDESISKGGTVAVITMNGEIVGIGTAMMSSDEIMKRSEGIAIDVTRVLMPTGTYRASWKTGGPKG